MYEDATASQLAWLISVLGIEGHALSEFAFKNDMIVLCTTQTQVQSEYLTILIDAWCKLEIRQAMQMVGSKRSLEQMENWLGMPVQVQCTTPKIKTTENPTP